MLIHLMSRVERDDITKFSTLSVLAHMAPKNILDVIRLLICLCISLEELIGTLALLKKL
jgi:hypothetical protein